MTPAGNLAREQPFRHEALFYAGEDEFVERTSSFIEDGLGKGEPVLVAVVGPKIDAIKSSLRSDAGDVLFADMAEVGRNPARIIPMWREFVDAHAPSAKSVRGIGEPIWAARTPEEMIESQRHEALLNLAFADDPAWILCPYDTLSLGEPVLDEARRSHPYVLDGGVGQDSSTCLNPHDWAAPFDHPLPEAPETASSFPVTESSLSRMRYAVYDQALKSGLEPGRADDLVIAVNELATNCIRHGAGRGTLRMWNTDSSLICEVADQGRIADTSPLLGRERPNAEQEGGFGLWLVNQLCDLAQFRAFPTGSVARLFMTL